MDRPIRLMEMLQLLGGRRSWRPAELAERFGMSERNIYRDLQALTRLYGIPVTNDDACATACLRVRRFAVFP